MTQKLEVLKFITIRDDNPDHAQELVSNMPRIQKTGHLRSNIFSNTGIKKRRFKE